MLPPVCTAVLPVYTRTWMFPDIFFRDDLNLRQPSSGSFVYTSSLSTYDCGPCRDFWDGNIFSPSFQSQCPINLLQ